MFWPLWIMERLANFQRLADSPAAIAPAKSVALAATVAVPALEANRGPKMAEVSDTVLQQVLARLTAIESKQTATYQLLISVYNATGVELMSLQDVLAKVEAQTTVIAGVETLVAGLVDLNSRLKAAVAAQDPALVEQISNELDANTARMTHAIEANTAPPAP